jgi:hypothetical protein
VDDNKVFCEQMADAIVNLGTNEALSCMARMMVAIAQNQNLDLQFDCDLGVVSIERKNITLSS